MSLLFIFFGILGILAIASAVVTISSKNPLTSAIALVFHFFMLAGLYLSLNAQFIAVVQILVYAGAIMVLVIFVIMLLNLQDEEKLKEKYDFRKIIAITFGFVLIIQFVLIFGSSKINLFKISVIASQQSTVESIGKAMFQYYLLPFEAVGILLLAAIVGAIILAKRKLN